LQPQLAEAVAAEDAWSQAAGLKLWMLPGGKVKRGESLVKALKFKEIRLRVQIGSLLEVLV